MFCNFPSNCTGFPYNCDWASQSQDSDVPGIGVVWAFGITSLITVLCSMPIMLVSLLELISSHSKWVRLFISKSTPPAPTAYQWRSNLKDAIIHITLGLSDQQLVTGLAILITGYTKHCSMKSRHWWIVFDLAFFSSVTHLASIPALRDYFTRYRRFRDLRVFLMLSNYIMLLVSAILSFRDYDERTKYCPVRCTFDQIRTKRFGASGVYIVQMVFLSVVFVWQLVMLYVKPEVWWKRHEMIVMAEGGQRAKNGSEATVVEEQLPKPATDGRAAAARPEGSLQNTWQRIRSYTSLRWLVLLLLTPPAPIVWAFILTMWGLGIKRLLWDRQWAIGDENHWSFGQVLPLLLVILPFFTVIEVFQEGNGAEATEKPTSSPEHKEDNEPIKSSL